MKKINKNNKIFGSEDFQKDKYKFFLITQNLKCDSVLLYSDEENYVICRGAVGFPTWIWTKDGISRDKVIEVEEAMKYYLTDNVKDKFTCKKELYDYLLEDDFEFLNRDDYFELGTMRCKKLKKPKVTDGKMVKPSLDEMKELTTFYCNRSLDIGKEKITQYDALEIIKKMINSNTFYIWKNDAGKIVCMAEYIVIDSSAKIKSVYTPTEERGKAYAANLIHDLTSKLLSDGLVPLLYTDYNYPASNKAYINAGYEDTGILINFSCSKEKIKQLRK